MFVGFEGLVFSCGYFVRYLQFVFGFVNVKVSS